MREIQPWFLCSKVVIVDSNNSKRIFYQQGYVVFPWRVDFHNSRRLRTLVKIAQHGEAYPCRKMFRGSITQGGGKMGAMMGKS